MKNKIKNNASWDGILKILKETNCSEPEKYIAKMKKSFTLEEYISLCNQVADHHKKTSTL